MTDDLINFIDEDDVVESQRDHSVEPWLVLMVDDDNDVHTVTRMSLGGFVVNERLITLKSAFTGQEALDMVCQKGARLPDLVLMDVVMATPTDGIDTVHLMRKTLALKNIPFVIVRTGQAGLANEETLRCDPDVDMVLTKGDLDVDRLKSAVRIGLTTGLARSNSI